MFEILLHPFTLITTLIFSIIFMRDLIGSGSRLHHVHKCVYRHIEVMASQNVSAAWDGLSFDLKTTLTQKKRLKKGKGFFGSKRVEKYANYNQPVYQKANLVIESIHRVTQSRTPKIMYMVRLRSKQTGYMRMTIWIARVPHRVDGWSIEEVCVHPPTGDVYKGDTLTGTRLRSRKSRLAKAVKDRARRRGLSSGKSLAKAS